MVTLPDCAAFRAQLDAALHYAGRHGEEVAVLHVEVEEAGADEPALERLAERIGALARRSDRIARVGERAFAVMLQGRNLDFEPARTAERLLEGLGAGEAGAPRAWVGIAGHPPDGADPGALLRDAAAAAETARKQGERYRFCGEAMTDAEARGLVIADRLRFALEREQLQVHYQARVDGGSGRVQGAEALLRWREPELGWVPPAEFVPVAERLGLMDEIGGWVMREACVQHARWAESGCGELLLSVNVSGHQVQSGSLRDAVVHAILDSGLPPRLLEIELTESALVESEGGAATLLREFADLGVCLALDDFGTGYSSLGYLRQFPVSTLKIDASFVREIRADEPFPPFVEALLALSRSLGLTAVAEGVETRAQRDALLERGCREMQGYLFGAAVPADEFAARLESDSGRSALR